MNLYLDYIDLRSDFNVLRTAFQIVFVLFVLVVIRNWYNLFKKRSYRKNNNALMEQLEASQLAITKHDGHLKKVVRLEEKLNKKHTEIFELQLEIAGYKQDFYSTLSQKEKEIAHQKEAINHQRMAYERYVSFKNVEANNSRLGAHFIKNVISQIYEDLEDIEMSQKSFLGIPYKNVRLKKKIPSIKALKNIFKLLDYNVSALTTESTTIEEELLHINMFLELIIYLKPNAKIELNNALNAQQNTAIKIKPTLFFPFVENALKHGNLNDENSFISIDLKQNEQKQLSYCLVNSAEQRSTAHQQMPSTSSFGFNALKQLLDAYYPGSKLEYVALPNKQYMSQLTLKLKE